MTDLSWVGERYRVASELLKWRVEIWPVGDPLGCGFDQALRKIMLASPDITETCSELISAAKALRWRLLTSPEPWRDGGYLCRTLDGLEQQARHLRGAIGADTDAAIANLVDVARRLAGEPPVVIDALLTAIREVDPSKCVAVVVNRDTAQRISSWLAPQGTNTLTAGELANYSDELEQVYVVGPPRFFPATIVESPATTDMAFLFPEWCGDRSLKLAPLSAYSQGASKIRALVRPVNPSMAEMQPVDQQAAEIDMEPTPPWPVHTDPDHPPRPQEALARRVYLSGGYLMFLDDGERIRTIDPAQPPEERLGSMPTAGVQPGTYLLLRTGENERGTLHRAALSSFPAKKSRQITQSQAAWKALLSERLHGLDMNDCLETLRDMGIKAASRVGVWADPSVDRPQRNADFSLLLNWLGLDEQPTFSLATELRRKRQQLGYAMRLELEKALSESDLEVLVARGHSEVPATNPLFRGMIAARVLAISPWREIVPMQQTRVLFEDHEGGGQWLE